MAGNFAEGLSRLSRTPGFKFFLVGFLVFLLSIPLLFVYLLVTERSGRFNEVASQIAQEWGGTQALSGPYLIVPYTVKIISVQNDRQIETIQERRAIFLPDKLNVVADAKSEVRKRSIFEITVYSTQMTLEGRFAVPNMSEVEPEAVSIRWRDAIVALGLSDVSGLKNAAALGIDGESEVAFEPSLGLPNAAMTGIHAKLAKSGKAALSEGPAAFAFKMTLSFNGSSELSFAPVARETAVSVSSDWRHPSFSGAYLPEKREIGPGGFKAHWAIPHLARSVPQAWSETIATYVNPDRFQSFMFGVKFYIPIDYYNLVTRAAKYGLMFLAVAFVAIFVLELRSAVRVHAVQYVFVGIAMTFFYVLLLSFSEHTGFTVAYLIASIATGVMLSLYVGKSLGSREKGLVMFGVFLLLYSLLYLILRLEDYALLAGAIAGFVLLTVTMFATLRVNWSQDK